MRAFARKGSGACYTRGMLLVLSKPLSYYGDDDSDLSQGKPAPFSEDVSEELAEELFRELERKANRQWQKVMHPRESAGKR